MLRAIVVEEYRYKSIEQDFQKRKERLIENDGNCQNDSNAKHNKTISPFKTLWSVSCYCDVIVIYKIVNP